MNGLCIAHLVSRLPWRSDAGGGRISLGGIVTVTSQCSSRAPGCRPEMRRVCAWRLRLGEHDAQMVLPAGATGVSSFRAQRSVRGSSSSRNHWVHRFADVRCSDGAISSGRRGLTRWFSAITSGSLIGNGVTVDTILRAAETPWLEGYSPSSAPRGRGSVPAQAVIAETLSGQTAACPAAIAAAEGADHRTSLRFVAGNNEPRCYRERRCLRRSAYSRWLQSGQIDVVGISEVARQGSFGGGRPCAGDPREGSARGRTRVSPDVEGRARHG